MIEKDVDTEAKVSLEPLSETMEIDSKCLKAIDCQLKKTKRKLLDSTRMGIKIRPSHIIPLLLIISLNPRTLKMTNVMKAVKATQLFGSMPPK